MVSQDSVTNSSAPPTFSSSFGYWAEVPKGAVLVPHWHRQTLATEPQQGCRRETRGPA
jgi:hypothetical protein